MKTFSQFLLLMMTLILAIPVSAQTIKRNPQGQKIIKRISSDVLQKDGSAHPRSYNYRYDMTYFPDGRLKSIEFSHKDFDIGGRRGERISIANGQFKLEYITKGRVENYLSYVFDSHQSNDSSYHIESITRIHRQRNMGASSFSRYCYVSFYNRYRSLRLELMSSPEETLQDVLKRGMDMPESVLHEYESTDLHPPYPLTDFLHAGFSHQLFYLIGQDGYAYYFYTQQENDRFENDGNLSVTRPGPKSNRMGDVFTDYINDTNINLQFFFEIDAPEMLTEWLPVRSKNLVEYEALEKWSRKNVFRKHWEYEFDSEGNLIGAVVKCDYMLEKPSFKIKIEYVYE